MQTSRTNTLFATLAALAALGLAAHPAAAQQSLYVSSTGDAKYNNTVEKFTPNGVETAFVSNVKLPYGLAFDGSGNLFVSDLLSSQILKVTPDGVKSVFSNDVRFPGGLALDSMDNVYVAGYYGSSVTKITPSGTSSLFVTNPPGNNSVLAYPLGTKFDSAGNLYVANSYFSPSPGVNSNSIEKITPNGTASVFATAGLNSPTDLAFDSAGNLYVSSFLSNTIEKFATDGTASVFASTGLSGPSGLAFDNAGLLYVANNTSNSIERFTPDGVGSIYLQDPGDKSVLNSPSFIAFGPAAAPVPEASTTVSLGLLLTLGVAGVAFKARKRTAKTA